MLERAAAAWVVCALTYAGSADGAPGVQIRGAARLDVKVSGDSGAIRIAGVLTDELGGPIREAEVVFTATDDAGASSVWALGEACAAHEASVRPTRAEIGIQTDNAGAFCANGGLALRSATVRVEFAGDGHHGGTSVDVHWDAAVRSASLWFAPRPERIDLDQPRVSMFGRLAAPDGVSLSNLEVRLETGDGKELAVAKSGRDGRVNYELEAALFDGPGIGVLRLRFAGDERLSAAQEVASVTRTARVRLAVDAGQVRGDPSRGVAVVVRATSIRGAVDGGAVEAVFRGVGVGVGHVRDGTAEVTVTMRLPRDANEVSLLLRYLPEAPYYDGGQAIPLTVTVSKPQPWFRGIPLAIAVVVAAWLLRGWHRPPRRAAGVVPNRGNDGVASVAIVAASKDRATWSGRVVDAHDGEALSDARIKIVAPSFAELDLIADVAVGLDGAFEFRVASAERNLKMRVEAPRHTGIERALPEASDMRIALVSRRRALVERLVAWARRAGKPWDRAPEATPGHLVRVANAQRNPRSDVSEWASRVERRAYGPEPMDAVAEREVTDIEPGGPTAR